MGRRRRPAAETREEMMQAAQELLVANGPNGVRLDDVAEVVGVSRQAVLHHFGSRDGLLRAVVERAWMGLFADLGGLAAASDGLEPAAFLDLLDERVRGTGNARLGAWLLLSGSGLPVEVFQGALSQLPGAVQQAWPGEVTDEDARYGLILVAAALFGDAIFGERIRQVLGTKDTEEERAAFRRWLATRLADVG